MTEDMRMMNLLYAGADGHPVNYDREKDKHYGVISGHKVMPEALDDIAMEGRDLYYEEFVEDMKDKLRACFDEADHSSDVLDAIDDAFSDEMHGFIKGLKMAVEDWFGGAEGEALEAGLDYIDEEAGQFYEADCASYIYEDAGYVIRFNTDDMDMFVCRSPFFTRCRQCSPCAPNAGYLTDRGGGMEAYCLGVEWFEDEKAPYDIYDVETGELVYKCSDDEDDQ